MPYKSSTEFLKLYQNLPPEAQQDLVENHLATLLDSLPKEKAKNVLTAATRRQNQLKGIPKLDVKGKRKEVYALLEELHKASKLSFIKERVNRDEILDEIFHSLLSWLNDIWTVVFTYNVQFLQAHNCLMLVVEAFNQLMETSDVGGCKCGIMNTEISVSIKDKKIGKVIKCFEVTGPQKVDRILLWIWRDLFVSLCARGSFIEKAKIPSMLEDIESLMGWDALERLLYGGKKTLFDEEDEEDDDEEDGDEDDIDDIEDDDEDEDYYTDSDSGCTCHLHSRHWSDSLNEERTTLRNHVEKRLHTLFYTTPSLRLYRSLISISACSNTTERKLLLVLAGIATSTSETLVAAIDIYASNGQFHQLISLLNSHSYLLRPSDAPSLRCAVAVLSDSPFYTRGLEILEKELLDCLTRVHAALRASFTLLDDEVNKRAVNDIVKLRRNSPARQSRVAQWVEGVVTSSGMPMHPMAFAAMMMGFPMVPGMEDGDDMDILNYVDLDQTDPDLDELREEFRPQLKVRFDGWAHLGQDIKGGPLILLKVYAKAIELMPFLRAPDIVVEMIGRISDRPSKTHICEALENLSAFCKLQHKKLSLKADQQRRKNQPAQSGKPAQPAQPARQAQPAQPTQPASASASPSPLSFLGHAFAFSPGGGLSFGASPIPPPTPPLPPGMEDVD